MIGDLVFFNSDNFYAKFIRHFNRVKYGRPGWSHVGIITNWTTEGLEIAEAIGSGFTISFYKHDWISERLDQGKIHFRTPKGRITRIREHSLKYEGAGYGWTDIWWIAVHTLTGFKFGGSANKLICSEAVARILYDASKKRINFEKEYDKSYSLITPMDVYDSKFLKW